MKIAIRLVLCLWAAASLYACAPANPTPSPTPPQDPFRIPPYLLFTGQPDSMTLMWKAESAPREVVVTWGSDESCSDGKAAVADSGAGDGDQLMSYTITGLQPGRRTWYQVSMDGTSRGGSFFTAPADANAFSIYAVSDTQVNPAVQDRLMAGILAEIQQSPDTRQTILLHGGDHVSHGLSEPDWIIEYFNAYYKNVSATLATLPVVGALSNHHLYGAKEYVKICSRPYAFYYRKYFPYGMYATPENFYYSIDYGGVHITFVDPYTAEYQPGSQQYRWLEADLAKPAGYKIVVVHQTMWAYRNAAWALRQHLHPLFKASGVSVVLQGHEHYYNRLVVDGIQYVTIGGGGGTLTQPYKYRVEYDDPADYEVMSTCVNVDFTADPLLPVVDLVDPQKAFRINHYLRMDWDGKAMSLRAVDIDGKIIDCFPDGAQCNP